MINVTVEGGTEVRIAFATAATGVDAVFRKTGQAAAQKLLTAIRASASGRPGPRVQTGNYRRSWRIHPAKAGNSYTWEVGTDAPQGWRLEKGFVGVDSLGRRYNQPPFPHVGINADRTAVEFPQALDDAILALFVGNARKVA